MDVNCYRFICVGVDVKCYRLFGSYCIYLSLQLLAFSSVKPAVIPSMNKPAVKPSVLIFTFYWIYIVEIVKFVYFNENLYDSAVRPFFIAPAFLRNTCHIR
jgi:hypothetical protein